MPSIIRATTSSGLQIAPDNSGSLQFQTNGTTAAVAIDTSQNLQFNSGYGSVATAYGCRAWVNFNGTGTVSIRASGNVSSITDNGTGTYTINFTTSMPDVNYSWGGCVPRDSGGYLSSINLPISGANYNTSSFQIITNSANGGGFLFDYSIVTVQVFR